MTETPAPPGNAIGRRRRMRRGGLRRFVFAAALTGALLLAACTTSPSSHPSTETASAAASGPSGAAPVAFPDTPAGAQARWLVGASEHLPIPDAQVRAHFAATVLATFSPAQINQELQTWGKLTPTGIQPSEPTVAVFQAAAAPQERPVQGVLSVDAQGLITGVSVNPIPASPTTWNGVDSLLRSVAPQVRLLAAEVTDGSCRPLHAIDPTTTAPVGSVLKLYVLAALGTAVKSGTVSWTQQLTVTPELKSLPSGVLQDRPDGTQVSVQDLATAMISISDNTATDMLIHQLGRPAVEAELHAAGMADPSRNEPLLTTRETFILALEQWPTLAERYTAADPAGRRKLLETVVDRAPLPSLEAAQALTDRHATDAIGWFASAQDICRAYLRLADLAAQPGLAPIAGVLQVNDGGLQLDPNQWRRTWFKGEVGPGVLSSAYLATTQTGRSYVVAAVTENPSQPIAEGADLSMLAAIRGAFTLAAQS